MHAAIPNEVDSEAVCHEPLAVTLRELLEVLSEVTENEDEIVATLLYMVEGRRVRLVTPDLPTAL